MLNVRKQPPMPFCEAVYRMRSKCRCGQKMKGSGSRRLTVAREQETRIPDDSKTDYYKFVCKNRLYPKLRLISNPSMYMYLPIW
jgi:hypothetical protein